MADGSANWAWESPSMSAAIKRTAAVVEEPLELGTGWLADDILSERRRKGGHAPLQAFVELFPGELETERRNGVHGVKIAAADAEFLGDVLAVVGEQ